ncbi:MAG TPA: Gfo/Idh/MocA family oxidoreductase [Xanthobacteraceae bacterium]|nr:Gfo/Idh/MocA family oxidoreductase [Xanthobacteraceae bacterium]
MVEARKLRVGMVGGGPGAFIGPVHRIAAELDGKIELVAGAFSQSAERSRAAASMYRINPGRAYADYKEMIEAERRRADGIDFVAIVTPNHLHLPVAEAALEAGIPVMSDKPATATYDEALKLEATVTHAGLPYGLTHTYAGYPMVREARAMCAAGKLGKIRKVAVEYFQGWLSRQIETGGHKQAEWRTDPARSGPGGAIGDIGTHAFHLLEYVSGLKVTAINATLRTVVAGRRLDDDCNAILRMNHGAAGTLACSQVAAGEMNELHLRIYGESGSLEWRQQEPNRLIVKWLDKPEEMYHAGAGYLSKDALAVTRTPSGHPEGYLEAFATLYGEFADALIAWKSGEKNPLPATLPGIEAGVRGMRFIERAIESNRKEGWVEF